MSDRFHWARLLAFVSGLVNQELLLRNEYLTAENPFGKKLDLHEFNDLAG